jgi:hypothetical protein
LSKYFIEFLPYFFEQYSSRKDFFSSFGEGLSSLVQLDISSIFSLIDNFATQLLYYDRSPKTESILIISDSASFILPEIEINDYDIPPSANEHNNFNPNDLIYEIFGTLIHVDDFPSNE